MKEASSMKRVLTTPPRIVETPVIDEEKEDEVGGVILRPNHLQQGSLSEEIRPEKAVNKHLRNLDAPFMQVLQRPASENDIFTISTPTRNGAYVSSTTDVNRLSMTPEVPSISFKHLPHNYLETPTIEYRKEGPSLLEIQTAEIRNSMTDFSMPRYYGKSDLILNRSFDAVGSTSSIGSTGSSSSQSKKIEKSKRLKHLRTHLPPLTIHIKDKSEKEK